MSGIAVRVRRDEARNILLIKEDPSSKASRKEAEAATEAVYRRDLTKDSG